MGSCEGTRARRRRGGAGALRAGVGAMLLGLSQSESVLPQAACGDSAAPLDLTLTQPTYEDMIGGDNGGALLKPLVNSFLSTVQPKPFPQELVLKAINNSQQVLKDQEFINEVLDYEMGYLVCAAIGVLYIVLMPLIGFFLACCRCCGSCGGKMYQKQTSSTDCRRRTLYWSTFVTTVIILAGNICMFKSNEALKVSVGQSPEQLATTVRNIRTLITAVPQQILHVVEECSKPIEQVSRNLDNIGPKLGTEIQQRFLVALNPALQPLRRLDQETRSISDQFNRLNSASVRLQGSMNLIQQNVTAVRDRIDRTLSNPSCFACERLRPELQKLSLDASLTLPSMTEMQSAVDRIQEVNLPSRIEEVDRYFNSIPQTVTDETRDTVQISKVMLAQIKTQISQVSNKIPLSALTKMLDQLDQANAQINNATAHVVQAEEIRWKVCTAVCVVVLLVVVCNLLGLVLGPLGLSPKADPTKRSCPADCGGTFLMMGAGVSFLFSWLFMIVVLLLFLVGGNVNTLVCRPWNNGQLLEIIDSPGLIPNLSQTLDLQVNISVSGIYRDCENNQPMWTTLQLHKLINLDDLLNVSKHTEDIQTLFDSVHISLSTTTLLSPVVREQLRSFSSSVQGQDFAAITQKINDISQINLNTTAARLEEVSAATSGDTKDELLSEANDLRQIQASMEATIFPQLENLNTTVTSLQSSTEKINGTVGEVLVRMDTAQVFLNTNTAQIVMNESRVFLNCQLGYFNQYADWAKLTITQEVGRCQPVARAVDSLEIILCSYLLEPLNAFWCSLGWCIAFFIPSIIFSIKLAKYYRKMKYDDPSKDDILMDVIPRAQMIDI